MSERHGHVTRREDGIVVRYGGPETCRECQREAGLLGCAQGRHDYVETYVEGAVALCRWCGEPKRRS